MKPGSSSDHSLTAAARRQVEQLRELAPWSDGAKRALWSRIDASAQAPSPSGARTRWIAVAGAIALAAIALAVGSRGRNDGAGAPAIASGHVASATSAAPPTSPASPTSPATSALAQAEPSPMPQPVSPTSAAAGAGSRTRARVTASSSQFGATAAGSGAVPSIATDRLELPHAAPTFEACAALATPAAQQPCFTALADDDGPAAANALYALAALDRDALHDDAGAVRALRDYQRRFPDGPLGPEVALAVIAELRRDPCNRETLAEIERFLQRYPGDGRAAAVERLRAALERSPATGC